MPSDNPFHTGRGLVPMQSFTLPLGARDHSKVSSSTSLFTLHQCTVHLLNTPAQLNVHQLSSMYTSPIHQPSTQTT